MSSIFLRYKIAALVVDTVLIFSVN